jgi:hypothetical protein
MYKCGFDRGQRWLLGTVDAVAEVSEFGRCFVQVREVVVMNGWCWKLNIQRGLTSSSGAKFPREGKHNASLVNWLSADMIECPSVKQWRVWSAPGWVPVTPLILTLKTNKSMKKRNSHYTYINAGCSCIRLVIYFFYRNNFLNNRYSHISAWRVHDQNTVIIET